MKKILILISFCILYSESQFAQVQKDEPINKTDKKITRMGGAGGFTPFLLFWNVNEINNSFAADNIPKLTNQPVILYGGQGYGYIMLIENFRVGGLGASGNSKSSLVDGSTKRDLESSVSFGGVTLDYVFPLSERLDFTAGILLGGGDMDIKIRRDDYGIKTWNGLINNWSSGAKINNFSYSFNGSFMVIQPSLNIEYAWLRWLGFRIGASYNFMFSSEWKLDDKFDVAGVPEKLNSKGVIINFGIFLGTFLF